MVVRLSERERSDEVLARRARSGDLAAFATLYGRHAPGVYDFAFRITRDPHVAATVVERTFARAWTVLPRRNVDDVRAWLYTVAYHAAADELRRAAPAAPIGHGNGSVRSSGAPAPFDDALGRLVWSAATELNAQDYSLLDLHLRRHLDADDLAEGIGVEKSALETRLVRLEEWLDEVVTARSDDSDELDRSPAEIFSELDPVPLDPELRRAIWERVMAASGSSPLSDDRARRAPIAAPMTLLVAVIALVAVALAAGGTILALRAGPEISDPRDVRSSTHEVRERTGSRDIVVVWTATDEARGYSFSWSYGGREVPDEERDLLGDGERATHSARPGDVYFNLRTQRPDGSWTSGVHLGPFVIAPVPDTSIKLRPPKASASRKATFRFTASERATFECRLDGRRFSECASPKRYRRLDDGRHRFAVRAVDDGGNVERKAASFVWRVDTKRPATRITTQLAPSRRERSVLVAFSSPERKTSFECRLDDAPWERCRSPKRYFELPDGNHAVRVRAEDVAGNIDRTPAVLTWEIDTEVPETRIASGPTGRVTSRSATFAFAASEDGVSFACRVDSQPFRPCSSPTAYRGLSAGEHVFAVRASDAAGNVDRTPATRTWTADPVPTTTITSGPDALVRSRSVTFALRASEPGSTFECSIDGGAFKRCGSSVRYAGLPSGRHSFRARARDSTGNVDATPARWTWTIDAVPPNTTITSHPAAQTGDASPTFRFVASEAGSSFECRIDGNAFRACSSPARYSNLGRGSHTFAVRATDRAGNTDGTPATWTWTID
jgi:DNA-directed RNA polymerase specialized sigma24 family protein